MSDPPVIRALKSMTNSVKAWDTTPLHSIFNQIAPSAEPNTQTSTPYFLQAQRFSLTESALFPITERPPVSADLQTQFNQAIEQCHAEPSIHVVQMLSLFHDYAWAVSYQPTAGETADPVVSLYDYARTKAALAAAGEQTMLVGGDLSGVQDFIYTIAANRAAKSLRGRSFYLQMLTDALAGWVLQQAGMPSTNLLYSGGGRFYVIVPAACYEQLAQWRRALGQFLLNVHDGELYIALGGATIADAAHNFEALFRAVNDQVTADKRRRFATLDNQELQAKLFTPRGHRGNEDDRCATCGYMGPSNQFEADEDDSKICRLCESTIKLAFSLHDAQFLCISQPQPNLSAVKGRTNAKDILAGLGLQAEICFDQQELIDHLNRNSAQSIHVQIIRPFAGDLAMLSQLRANYRQHVFSIRPIVNVTPKAPNGEVKSFDQLAKASRGIKRFGVLRMDVDDLGDIFGYSLAKASLARISSLSAAFSRFFEGWVGEICRDQNIAAAIYQPEQASNQAISPEQIYSVYSGGDDLFLVGSWDVLAHVANRIQHDLQRYTGYNQLIHVSAGLTLHTEKFPLYQAAKLAHHALDQAKDAAPRQAIRKNALDFLDQTIAWEAYPALINWHQRLWRLYQGEHGMVRSLLQVLMELYSQYNEHSQQRQKSGKKHTAYGPWIWRGKYQLARIRQRYENHQELQKLLRDIDEDLFTGFDDPHRISLRTIEQLGLAARWTQLLIREQGD